MVGSVASVPTSEASNSSAECCSVVPSRPGKPGGMTKLIDGLPRGLPVASVTNSVFVHSGVGFAAPPHRFHRDRRGGVVLTDQEGADRTVVGMIRHVTQL